MNDKAPTPLQLLAQSIASTETALTSPVPADPRTAPAWEMARADFQRRLEELLDRSVAELLDRAQVVVEVGARLGGSAAGRVDAVVDTWAPFRFVCAELELCCNGSIQPYTVERALQLRVALQRWVEMSTFYGRLAALRQGQASQPLCDRTGPLYLNRVDEGAIQSARFASVEELRAVSRVALTEANPDHSITRVAVLDALRAARPTWDRTPRVLVTGTTSEAEARRLAQMFQRGAAVVTSRELPREVDGDFVELLFET